MHSFTLVLLLFLGVFCILAGNNFVYGQDASNKCPCRPRKQFFIVIYFKLSFYEAFEYCRYQDMILASVDSQEDNDRIVELRNKLQIPNENLWLSANDLGQEGRFIWGSNGKPIEYNNFAQAQPDDYQGSEDCVLMWPSGKWNDLGCGALNYFVCEYYCA